MLTKFWKETSRSKDQATENDWDSFGYIDDMTQCSNMQKKENEATIEIRRTKSRMNDKRTKIAIKIF